METLNINTLKTDLIPGEKMYAALIKRSNLSKEHYYLKNVAGVRKSDSEIDFTTWQTGALIANTAVKTNIPIIFVAPENFDTGLQTYIKQATRKDLFNESENISIESFLSLFAAYGEAQTISSWDTFARWLGNSSNGYTRYLSESNWENTIIYYSLGDGQSSYITEGGSSENAFFTTLTGLFTWLKDNMSSIMLQAPAKELMDPNNSYKFSFAMRVTGLAGTWKSYVGSDYCQLSFQIRL